MIETTPDEIRRFRERRRLTQEKLAEQLGVTKTCVQHWENARRKAPPYLGYALKWLARRRKA